MFVTRVTPTNLRAFWNSSPIVLGPGVTLLFGKNNSGKTTLLEALASGTISDFHRGLENSPTAGEFVNSLDSIELDVQFDASDLMAFLASGQLYTLVADFAPGAADSREAVARAHHDHVVGATFSARVLIRSGYEPVVIPTYVDSFQHVPRLSGYSNVSTVMFSYQGNRASNGGYDCRGAASYTWPHGHELAAQLYRIHQARAFRFEAARRSDDHMPAAPEVELNSRAQNLVTVLHTLTSDRDQFLTYETRVKRVLPEIGQILVPPSGSPGSLHIELMMAESVGRRDLAFRLKGLGTGTEQILALVHAITMSPKPRIILIDEPSTYLHPGATRELMNLIAEFDHHQYVIATHTPLALDVFTSPRIVLLERTQTGTVRSQSIDARVTVEQRLLLRELGSSLQDVFGADHVVWVEGPTETEVYRLVMKTMKHVARGVVILPIVSTGDLQSRDRTTMAEIYQRLTTHGGLVPSNISFILDNERRSDQEVKELQLRTSNRVFFTAGVRLLESIFLEPSLISKFLTQECAGWSPAILVNEDDIAAYWDRMPISKRHSASTARPSAPNRWRAEVHGANVLADTVTEFTQARMEYRKIDHGRKLTELCLEHWPSLLTPLVQTLNEVLGLTQAL